MASNDAVIISCSFDETIRVWNKELEIDKVLKDHKARILSVSISSDGIVASGSDDMVVW